MCYERRRAEACVDESAHHALVQSCELVCPSRTGWPVFPGIVCLLRGPSTRCVLVMCPRVESAARTAGTRP
jgi:hypothetical protein